MGGFTGPQFIEIDEPLVAAICADRRVKELGEADGAFPGFIFRADLPHDGEGMFMGIQPSDLCLATHDYWIGYHADLGWDDYIFIFIGVERGGVGGLGEMIIIAMAFASAVGADVQ